MFAKEFIDFFLKEYYDKKMRFLIYLILLGAILSVLWLWGRRQMKNVPLIASHEGSKSRNRFRGKNPQEIWIQVYETESVEEAKRLRAQLQEEDLECILYEPGKKDIHGNLLRGIGIAVPKTSAPLAQKMIARLLV